MKNKIVCPVCIGGKNKHRCLACKGTGWINPPKPNHAVYDKDGERKKAAEALRHYGYPLREIAEILGYKHPQSIKSLLDKSTIKPKP
jgi:hypothetical protein